MGKRSGDAAIASFVEAAESFCALIEGKSRFSKKQFYRQVLTKTLAIYSTGLQLPSVHPEKGYDPLGEWFEKNKGLPLGELVKQNPKTQERSQLRRSIQENLLRSLGGELPYRKIFEPFNDEEPVSPTISDDLEDIYCDMKEGLLAIGSSGTVSNNVVWEWKFGLESHWGRHAVGAIAALHSLVASE